jgi:hypothetical protein
MHTGAKLTRVSSQGQYTCIVEEVLKVAGFTIGLSWVGNPGSWASITFPRWRHDTLRDTALQRAGAGMLNDLNEHSSTRCCCCALWHTWLTWLPPCRHLLMPATAAVTSHLTPHPQTPRTCPTNTHPPTPPDQEKPLVATTSPAPTCTRTRPLDPTPTARAMDPHMAPP